MISDYFDTPPNMELKTPYRFNRKARFAVEQEVESLDGFLSGVEHGGDVDGDINESIPDVILGDGDDRGDVEEAFGD